jgi:hypothetical protein
MQMWVITPKQSAAFAWHMMDVLDVYHRPHEPRFPVIAVDDKPVQLLAHVREPLPAWPGVSQRQHHEDK